MTTVEQAPMVPQSWWQRRVREPWRTACADRHGRLIISGLFIFVAYVAVLNYPWLVTGMAPLCALYGLLIALWGARGLLMRSRPATALSGRIRDSWRGRGRAA